MEVNTIAELITNYGLGVILVVYLIYFNNKVTSQQSESYKELAETLKEVSKSMAEMNLSMSKMNDRISNLELCKRKEEK